MLVEFLSWASDLDWKHCSHSRQRYSWFNTDELFYCIASAGRKSEKTKFFLIVKNQVVDKQIARERGHIFTWRGFTLIGSTTQTVRNLDLENNLLPASPLLWHAFIWTKHNKVVASDCAQSPEHSAVKPSEDQQAAEIGHVWFNYECGWFDVGMHSFYLSIFPKADV